MNLSAHEITAQLLTLPIQEQQEALDFIKFLKSKSAPGKTKIKDAMSLDQKQQTKETKQRQKKIGECLTQLTKSNPFADIEDPVAWQREIRKDRPLFGREE